MLGQLARASAQGNPQQALALSGNLPALPKLTGVSLDDLEAKVAGQSHATVRPQMFVDCCEAATIHMRKMLVVMLCQDGYATRHNHPGHFQGSRRQARRPNWPSPSPGNRSLRLASMPQFSHL